VLAVCDFCCWFLCDPSCTGRMLELLGVRSCKEAMSSFGVHTCYMLLQLTAWWQRQLTEASCTAGQLWLAVQPGALDGSLGRRPNSPTGFEACPCLQAWCCVGDSVLEVLAAAFCCLTSLRAPLLAACCAPSSTVTGSDRPGKLGTGCRRSCVASLLLLLLERSEYRPIS
jgi:hypothetical protein